MIWMALLALVILASALWILGPFFAPHMGWDATVEQTDLDLLLDEKSRVLRALKDLDDERTSGGMDEDEYQESRREWLERAVQINREVAKLSGVDPTTMGREE